MEASVEWVAGLLEADGSYRPSMKHNSGPCPQVTLGMTDKDVVECFVDWFNRHFPPRTPREKTMKVLCDKRDHLGKKDVYRARASMRRAVLLMILLRPLVGARKTTDIDNSLAIWEAKTFGATS